MKKKPIISLAVLLAAFGVIIITKPAGAATAPYLLSETEETTTVFRALPIIPLQLAPKMPTAIPKKIPVRILENDIVNNTINISPSAKPSDCIDLDTAVNGGPAYPSPLEINDPSNTPATITICNKTYDRSGNTTPYGRFILVHSDNVTLDCDGASLIGNFDFNNSTDMSSPGAKAAIYSQGDNFTMKNCTFGKFGYGAYIGGGYDSFNHQPNPPKKVTIANNTFTLNSYIDLVISSATNSEIFNNLRAENSGNKGILPTIDLEFVSNSRIHDNTLYSQGGINLAFNSNNNQVYGNTLGKFPSAGTTNPNAIWINHGSAYNNIYRNTIIGPHEVWTGNGITFDGDKDSDDYKNTGAAKYNIVHHNTITDFWGPGISLLHDSHDNSISYNTYDGVDWGLTTGSGTTNGITYNPHNNRFEFNNMKVYTATAFDYGTHDNMFVRNRINFIADPNYVRPAYDMGINNHYNENGVGNYWNFYDNPANGCDDANRDGICDSPNPVYEFPYGPITNYDYYPISAVPVLQPISPVSVNELQNVVVRLRAANPAGLPFQYSINSTKFFAGGECMDEPNVFTWATNQYSSGYFTYTATVKNGIYSDSQSFNVRVNDTCYINKFGKWICPWPVQAIKNCVAI